MLHTVDVVVTEEEDDLYLSKWENFQFEVNGCLHTHSKPKISSTSVIRVVHPLRFRR